jgi:hypothetical protein
MAPTRTLIGLQALNGQMRSKAHTALTAPLVLHHTRIHKCAMKEIIFNGHMRNKPFLIVIYHSSLVKAAMNDERVSKLRNGVTKRLNFFFFFNGQRQNKDHNAPVNCGWIKFLKLRLAHLRL